MDRETAHPKILAVEDSPSARKLFQAVLLKLGVALPDLRLAASAPEALQIFSQWRPDIVFIDIELNATRGPPDPSGAESPARMDGDELARQFLERNPRLRLIVVTAFDPDNPRVKDLLEHGATEVIVKPVLAARVKAVLDRCAQTASDRPAGRARAARETVDGAAPAVAHLARG